MTSRYELRLTGAARRALTADLPEAIAFAAYAFITGPLLASPHRVGKALRPPYEGTHSARLGTYRVLYRIDKEDRTVIVLSVGSRSAIYRPRLSGQR
jgi:mRNA-degrading endonuclease RelE of RelBE toxin-antitoxin system